MTAKDHLLSVFQGQQHVMESELLANRAIGTHPVDIGSGAELRWAELFREFLPYRYQVNKGVVFDADGDFSESIDIIVYDRQYSPVIMSKPNVTYVAAESVYGVFEVKQTLSKEYVEYAGEKVASVRRLKRSSRPIRHIEGEAPAKQPDRILGGILATESAWTVPFGRPLESCLGSLDNLSQLDLGCALRSGSFEVNYEEDHSAPLIRHSGPEASLVFFYLRLLSRLQQMGTVPAIDYSQYERHLLH